MFITDNKLLIIGGNIDNYGKNINNTVELYEFGGNGDYFYTDINRNILLENTLTNHVYGGCCKGIGYDNSKICIGSNHYVELYDCNLDKWIFIGDKTEYGYNKSQLWIDDNYKHVLYFGGINTNNIQWIDIRQGRKWNVFKSNILQQKRWDTKLLLV